MSQSVGAFDWDKLRAAVLARLVADNLAYELAWPVDAQPGDSPVLELAPETPEER